jgi:hypothetical protein
LKYANRKIPVGFCPTCNRPIIYSSNGKDKNAIIVSRADDDYIGRTYLCAKCKTMVRIIEKTKATFEYESMPIIGTVQH